LEKRIDIFFLLGMKNGAGWSIRLKLMRHFGTLAASSVVDACFNPRGTWYRDWKHATEAKKGFPRHADSKDHLSCCVMCKEKENRSTNSKEISTMLNSNAIERNK